MPDRSRRLVIPGYGVISGIAMALLFMILFGLLWTDDEPMLLIKSISFIIGGLTLYGLLWVRFGRGVTDPSRE
jgi:hypothetical protein